MVCVGASDPVWGIRVDGLISLASGGEWLGERSERTTHHPPPTARSERISPNGNNPIVTARQDKPNQSPQLE